MLQVAPPSEALNKVYSDALQLRTAGPRFALNDLVPGRLCLLGLGAEFPRLQEVALDARLRAPEAAGTDICGAHRAIDVALRNDGRCLSASRNRLFTQWVDTSMLAFDGICFVGVRAMHQQLQLVV